MFKSSEERAADRRERDAQHAREQAERAEQARAAEEQRKREALLATPVGAATAAKDAGQQFFEVQLEVGGHIATAGFGSTEGRRTASSSAATPSTARQAAEIGLACFYIGQATAHDDPRILARHVDRAFGRLRS